VTPLRILVATDQWSPDTVGGSARVAADSARALARRGHELTVLTPAVPGLPEHATEDGVELARVLRRHGAPQTAADPVATWHAARTLRGRRFDVAVAHQTSNAAGLAAAGVGAPLVYVFHASVVLEERFLRRRVGHARRLAKIALDPLLVGLEHVAVSRADGIIVLSSFSRDLLLGRHPSAQPKIRPVAGGVGDAFFEEPPLRVEELRRRYDVPDRGLLLATVRRLEPRMGVDELLRAVARLDERRLVLAVAGDGMEHARLREVASELGISDRVRFLGRIPEAELRSLYAAADLFVLPTVAFEGFGMSTVEALASGTPVLGTAVGATPEILQALDPAFVVPQADAQSLAEGLGRVLPRLGDELRARCTAYARANYAWDAVIAGWEQAIHSVARIDDGEGRGNL
jgi:glycosyltransferase involved in cell wall biosynthesis